VGANRGVTVAGEGAGVKRSQHVVALGSRAQEILERPTSAQAPPGESGAGSGAIAGVLPRARWLWVVSGAVLCPVAVISAVLSFRSLCSAAAPIFGPLSVGFPLLVDMLILGATCAFLAGAKVGRPVPGWRWTAHGGAMATLALNALTASGAGTVPWHMTPPLVWSILVEMTARQVVIGWRQQHAEAREPIPARLWISSPRESMRIWLRLARTGGRHRQARIDQALQEAAVVALRAALPARAQRATRRLLTHQLKAGAISPKDLLRHLQKQMGTSGDDAVDLVFQAYVLGQERPAPAAPAAPATRIAREAGAGATPRRRTSAPTGLAAGSGALKPPLGASELHYRHRAVCEIVRARPGLSASQLADALSEQGWALSPRNARRVLAQVTEDLAEETGRGEAP
jgi:hypothetical protein